MRFHILIAVAAVHWLITMVACLVVFRWSFSSIRRRFWPAVIVSAATLFSSYWGLTRVRFAWSQTVNGHLQWRIDSRWFFTTSLVLGVSALIYALWRRWRLSHVA